VFIDPSGHHALISMTNGNNYYMHSVRRHTSTSMDAPVHFPTSHCVRACACIPCVRCGTKLIYCRS
jgi:hypothetical protein